LQQNTWIDDRKFLKSCVRARAEQGNINHPAYGTWTADFMSRQNKSRAFLGKYLNDPRVPWRHTRREMMAIAGIIPVAKWLAKIKQRSDVSCRLCKRAREQRCVKICRKRLMGTSTVLSAMEWRQLSRLSNTSSGDICMPACKLHNLFSLSLPLFLSESDAFAPSRSLSFSICDSFGVSLSHTHRHHTTHFEWGQVY